MEFWGGVGEGQGKGKRNLEKVDRAVQIMIHFPAREPTTPAWQSAGS